MSHSTAMLQPSPTAGPLTAAITGSGNRSISSMIWAPSRRLSSRATGSSRNEVIQPRSPPARNARPGAGEDHDPGLAVGGELAPHVGERPVQRLVDGVELVGPVDDDRADRAVGLDAQLVGQVVASGRPSRRRRRRTARRGRGGRSRRVSAVAGGRTGRAAGAAAAGCSARATTAWSRRRTRWRRGAGGRPGTRSRPPRPPPAAAPGRRPRASGRPASMLHSAYLASSSTPLRSTSASVSWNCTPWNVDERLAELLALEHVAAGEVDRPVEHAEQRPARQDQAERHVGGPSPRPRPRRRRERLEVELGDERRLAGRAGGRAGRGQAAAPVERHGGPRPVEAGQRARRGPRRPRPPARPTSSVGGPAQPLGHRVGHGPVPGAAAQGGGRLQLVVAAAGVEVPGAQLGEHGRHGRARGARGRPRPPARARRRRPPRAPGGPGGRTRCASSLRSMFIEAASRARASRIRCISMLPDATVADTA